MQIKELKVGDRVYSERYRVVSYKGEIQRLTKTTAVLGGYKFKREYEEGHALSQIGAGVRAWDIGSFYLETPELIAAVKRNETLDKISKKNFAYFDTATLEKVLEVLSNGTKHI